jgi:hypothetical protein
MSIKLFVDSKNRGPSETISKFSFIAPSSRKQYTSCQYLWFRSQITYYNVNRFNRSFTVNDGASRTVSLTMGNYTSGTQLAAEIQTRLNVGALVVFTCTYVPLTGLLTIDASGPFTFAVQTPEFAKLTGFQVGSFTAGKPYTATQIVNLIYTDYIVIRSNTLGIEERIYINTPPASVFYYEPGVYFNLFTDPRMVKSSIDFSILDEWDRGWNDETAFVILLH